MTYENTKSIKILISQNIELQRCIEERRKDDIKNIKYIKSEINKINPDYQMISKLSNSSHFNRQETLSYKHTIKNNNYIIRKEHDSAIIKMFDELKDAKVKGFKIFDTDIVEVEIITIDGTELKLKGNIHENGNNIINVVR